MTTPRTAAGRALLDALAPDHRQNYDFATRPVDLPIGTGHLADTRAAILAIEAEAHRKGFSEGLNIGLLSELAHHGYEDEPIMLNYGYGELPFGVEAALAWAERLADDLLEPQP